MIQKIVTADLVEKSDDGESDVRGYATVEKTDRDGDVIRVAGMSLSNHTETRPLKLLTNHRLKLDSGDSPVVGKVTFLRRCTHKTLGVPALMFGARFAPTPLGQQYKTLYMDGFLSDFSIGASVKSATPIRGGMDITESELLEISCCAIPVNQWSSVVKAMAATYPECVGPGCGCKSGPEELIRLRNRVAEMEIELDETNDELDASYGEPPTRMKARREAAEASASLLAGLKRLNASLASKGY